MIKVEKVVFLNNFACYSSEDVNNINKKLLLSQESNYENITNFHTNYQIKIISYINKTKKL